MSDKKSLRDKILAASDLKRELVEVPEWGMSVYVATMTGTERDAFESSTVTVRGKKKDINLNNFRARFLVKVLVDETGERIFSDADATDLGKKNSTILTRLFEVAQKLNGLGDEDVEELGKGLPNDQNGDSGSD